MDERVLQLFGEMLSIMRRLRKECPWDAKQTFGSLRQYTIEEVFELADAIVDDDNDAIRKELGDLVMHFLFYAVIAEEQHRFTLEEIFEGENEKLIYRHPHVFGENKSNDPREVEKQWEMLKLKEKGGNRRVLEGVPRSLVPLIKAIRIQEKASAVGFDWEEPSQIWGKLEEEIEEVKEAVSQDDPKHIEEEFGDLLFVVINAARLYGVDPDRALETCNRKFIRRFNYLEEQTIQQGKSLHEMPLEEMEKYWQAAKRKERED